MNIGFIEGVVRKFRKVVENLTVRKKLMIPVKIEKDANVAVLDEM